MAEIFFLRHGASVNLDAQEGEKEENRPIVDKYENYDPPLCKEGVSEIEEMGRKVMDASQGFSDADENKGILRKNVLIHFSPYLRTAQTADLLLSNLKEQWGKRYPHYKLRFQLLGDFALSDWIQGEHKYKPPQMDSNTAYQMYTPNIKQLKNKSSCSNFRPTTQLGPFNGPNLSYPEYEDRCKDYFRKLVAAYDKPANQKNKDIVILVTHLYPSLVFLSLFLQGPIYDQIPPSSINYSRKVPLHEITHKEGEVPESVRRNSSGFAWKLFEDMFGLLDKQHFDMVLNLESDIVYYKSNFIPKRDLSQADKGTLLNKLERPRPSFRVRSSSKLPTGDSIRKAYPICPSAKDWTPQMANKYNIKEDFKLKAMNDEAFKKNYDIINGPSRPISPEVSPCSEPTMNNSVVDLTKLNDNYDIYKPMKLKYSSTSEIPIHRLNSKVNLVQQLRSGGDSGRSSISEHSHNRPILSALSNQTRSTASLKLKHGSSPIETKESRKADAGALLFQAKSKNHNNKVELEEESSKSSDKLFSEPVFSQNKENSRRSEGEKEANLRHPHEASTNPFLMFADNKLRVVELQRRSSTQRDQEQMTSDGFKRPENSSTPNNVPEENTVSSQGFLNTYSRNEKNHSQNDSKSIFYDLDSDDSGVTTDEEDEEDEEDEGLTPETMKKEKNSYALNENWNDRSNSRPKKVLWFGQDAK